AITVGAVFMFTFTIFPGVVSGFTPGSRVSLLISTFQMLDVVGRFAPQWSALHIQDGKLVSVLAAARVLFIPLFILMQRESMQSWAQSAAVQFTVMVLLAFSNGYVSTLSMMLGPEQRGISPDEKSPVGTVMSLSLVTGIFIGSMLALPTQIGLTAAKACS
ncbi:unnamed protein product, partial [Effrenium voratum]